MTIYIALLRGINVGGHHIIKMTELKRIFESLGLERVKTYIQSGNVLFESKENTTFLEQKIENEIGKEVGFPVPVIVRSAQELQQIIVECPFTEETLSEGDGLHVSFLKEAPSPDRIGLLSRSRISNNEEKLHIEGKDIYLLIREGVRNSKLLINLQKLDVPATTRNWRTVNTLAALAKEM